MDSDHFFLVPRYLLALQSLLGSGCWQEKNEIGSYLSPREWHVHEMVFGFLPAVITGFLLTAIPNWTDRPPVRGMPLMLLFWLVGGSGVLSWSSQGSVYLCPPLLTEPFLPS